MARGLLLVLLSPLALVDAAAAGPRRSLQLLSEGETVISGVLNLHTSEGVEACGSSCKGAFAGALGVAEASVGCLCPESTDSSSNSTTTDTSARRRNLRQRHYPVSEQNRKLEELEASGSVLFTARVQGGLAGGATAVELLSESGWSTVASAFGVQESEVEITTLTVTPPSSSVANETLTVIAEFFDASDIDIVSAGGGTDWAGGGRGAALFLALLVLLVGTCCCGGGVLALALLCKAKKGGSGDTTKTLGRLHRKASVGESGGATKNLGHLDRESPSSGRSSSNSFAILERKSSRRQQPAENGNPRGSISGSDTLSAGGSALGSVRDSEAERTLLGKVQAKPVSAPREGSAVARGGDEAAGDRRAVVAPYFSDDGGTVRDVAVPRGVSPRGAGVGDVGSSGVVDDGVAVPQNVSMQESGGTNPLYKSVAPYALSAQGSQPDETPGRSRLSTFLGNATPARLRKLAGRMTPKSPALSGGSRRSRRSGASRHSRSGSSSSSRKHRRQGTFPGAYSQRNSSELDHQRPPADPVYTFMIKTIASKGFKFMSTTEIAFCAMRMYSHFRRTEGNYKRLTVMQNAENVSPVYEIIWKCDGKSDHSLPGESRFFSSTSGTDAEQQKSLLACLLALSWDGSSGSRKTLRRALTPTKPSKVPSPEDIFWDEFKDNTDALSGDDEMVAVARVVLLIAESANQPGQEDDKGSISSSSPSAAARARDEEEAGTAGVGIEHGDIMQALSGAHLREIGIAIKEARPGWQEAHVQLVSVLLVIAYLEEGARNTLPGGKRPDPLSSLEWVNLLTPDALDAFLVEKMEARRALVELDLEPSGLEVKQDDNGRLERVEPASGDKKTNGGSWIGSRGHGHQQILPKSTGRSARGSSKRDKSHRRNRSMESSSSTSSKPSPVVITTVLNRKASRDNKRRAEAPTHRSASSAASEESARQAEGQGSSGDRGHLRTIAQQRPKGRGASTPPTDAKGKVVELTIDTGDFAARVPAEGNSVRSDLSRGLSPAPSQTSSVVTRVYAPSSVDDQAAFPRAGASWAVEASDGRRSPDMSQSIASPTDRSTSSAMSQVSIAASRYNASPTTHARRLRGLMVAAGNTETSVNNADAMTAAGSVAESSSVVPLGASAEGRSQDLTGMAGTARPRSPSAFSDAGPSEAEFSDAASRFEMSHQSSSRSYGGPVWSGRGNRGAAGLAIEPPTPNSAAGSRFDTSSPASATTYNSRVGVGSPTATGGGGGGRGRGTAGAPLTGRSVASSMRSDGGSSFFKNSSAGGESQRSMGMGAESTSAASFDDEDLQNMGTRWLADRAYNQQFDEQK